MKIHEKILALLRESNSVVTNTLLQSIDLKLLEKFERKAESDNTYKRKLKDIESNLNGLTFEYNKKYQEIYNTYNELVVYEFLSDKLKTEMVNEVKGKKTPDFKLTHDETFCYSDLKTLNFASGNLNYLEIEKESFDINVKTEATVKRDRARGRRVHFSEPLVISPWKKDGCDQYDLKYIIEELISKLIANYKSKQINFNGSKGIFLIDVGQLLIPTSLEQGLPVMAGPLYKEPNSGILWNAAFGQIGDPVYNWIEFEGKPNIKNRLEKNGILSDISYEDLKAIAFITSTHEEKRIIGFHRSMETDESVLTILNQICDFVNDETNSNYCICKKD
ncbi:hypothetical protein [Flavobacterium alkalisoli]|uniref:hypothetical protein n=1 Tax=Flavobacterium alkalisoli TaxID=2602769 RepID=UPI003A918FF4